ncbi:MAG: NHLP bacteriocin export ABC transporter permease/ATPase subunit [Clostridia bacterium]|nr:NHLP bacteriocin export ABC transporter permease/ATPase subunit [Clostridia bacterium]
MKLDYLESQINQRRRSDNEQFQDAFSDLLSIIGIKTPKAAMQARGAVVEILNALGKEVPEVPDNISDLDSQLEYMLRPSQTMRRRVELKGEWWKDATGSFLGSTKDGDIIAIVPGRWSGYEYTDRNGKRVKINKETAKNINVDAFCFYVTFPLDSLKIKDMIKFMFATLSKADIAFIIFITFLGQIVAMISPHITKIIYDNIIPSGSTGLILPIATFLTGVTLGGMIIGLTKSIVMYRFQTRMSLTVNSAIMIRFFSLPTKFFKQYTAGELASRIGYISQLCQMMINAIISTSLTTVFSLMFIPQMYRFAPSLVVPCISVLMISIVYTAFMTFYQQRIYRKKLKLSPKLDSLTFALFGGMQKIKVSGAEKRAFAKWANNYSEIAKLDYSPPILIRINGIISLIISTVGLLFIYYFAVKSEVGRSNYLAFNSAYGQVSAAITTLSGVALQFANLGPILEMIKPILEQKPEAGEERKIPQSLSGDIDISNVTFRYTENGPKILDNINLKIKKGEYLGIVGTTGCGKSTLMRVLLGFETPEKGAVYYNGRDLATLDLRAVRQRIGVVMQNGSLFPGDIFSNIIVSSPWKTMDDAWEAAHLAGIDEDIKAMPMGMHTMISEGAGGLSGGQKQRLMIARAIIAKPSILFFDEATSALDNITQSHVAESIASLKSTRVVIAHRLSTIKNCDRIIVLDKGKIAESGTYDELMAKKGRFYELAIRQVVDSKV